MSSEEAERAGSASAEGDSEGVGYCRAPKEHRFAKGRSGNPKGRPKKPRAEECDQPTGYDVAASFFATPVQAEIGGKLVQLHPIEAALRKAFASAMAGGVNDQLKFLTMAMRLKILDYEAGLKAANQRVDKEIQDMRERKRIEDIRMWERIDELLAEDPLEELDGLSESRISDHSELSDSLAAASAAEANALRRDAGAFNKERKVELGSDVDEGVARPFDSAFPDGYEATPSVTGAKPISCRGSPLPPG